jgi:hypothetical protein
MTDFIPQVRTYVLGVGLGVLIPEFFAYPPMWLAAYCVILWVLLTVVNLEGNHGGGLS